MQVHLRGGFKGPLHDNLASRPKTSQLTGGMPVAVQYLSALGSPLGVRCAHLPLSLHDGVLSIPLYVDGQMPQWLDEVLEKLADILESVP